MSVTRERIDRDGKVSIAKIIKGTNIKPGDLVEIIHNADKIVLKTIKKKKKQGVVESVAGSWENRPDIVEEALHIRDEDDRKEIVP